MGRPPCCDKSNVKRGLWTAEEDAKLLAYVSNYGTGNWTLVPKKAGLNRCGKSCRLRWTNYLRPDLKHDSFTPQEEELIINLHQAIGSRWSLIAKQLPGRTDNDVKNYWNTKLRKRLSKMGIDPITHKPFSQIFSEFGNISGLANTTPNRMGSFNKNLNNKLMSKTEPSSIITGLSKMSINPIMEQVQDNSFASNPSWDFMAQFQVTNQDTVQPHFFGEVTSSCSSSSPTTATRLSSPQAYSCQPSLAQITPTSPFIWSEYLLSDPILSADLQQQKEQEFQGMVSASNSSSLTQNDISQCKFNSGNDHNFNRVEHEDSGIYYGEDTSGNQANKNADASCSSASSFVDAILDRDSEMGSQFPKLLDGCFDY